MISTGKGQQFLVGFFERRITLSLLLKLKSRRRWDLLLPR
jgi:hypothetical protein